MPTYAILTPQDNNNYGNRLQNYALSTILSNYGKVSSIKTLVPTASCFGYIKSCVRDPIKQASVTFGSFFSEDSRSVMKRRRAFLEFNKKIPYMKGSMSSYRGWRTPSKDIPDYVVVGSDQVWNYNWLSDEDLALYLGRYVTKHCRIISYAASIGVDRINPDRMPIFQKYLPDFQSISVRESQAINALEQIDGVKPVTVLDPTLLLSKADWEKTFRGFVTPGDKYVLSYFLGETNDELNRMIERAAECNGCRVRKLLDLSDSETFVAGPADFVELIANAEVVYTDSYHACCFSLLFGKDFHVFSRGGVEKNRSMNSRMLSLFTTVGIDKTMNSNSSDKSIDWRLVEKRLREARALSVGWLESSLNGGVSNPR